MSNEQFAAKSNKKTILVVEDSPVQALTLMRTLEREGLNVICAPNGQAGVTMALEYLPDAIVLDVQMPEMDGLQACRILKNDPVTLPIPVVILTAYDQPEILLAGFEGGAVDFIPKDAFSEIVLLETLRQLNILTANG